MKIIDYKVITNSVSAFLEFDVKKLIKEGFQPIGGISSYCSISGSGSYFSQAMVKYENQN